MEPMELILSLLLVLAGVTMIVNPVAVNMNKRRKHDKKVLNMIRMTGVLMVGLYTAGILYMFFAK